MKLRVYSRYFLNTMFYAVCLSSCSSKRVDKGELYKITFSRGYIAGANAAIGMQNDGTYSPAKLKEKAWRDSVEFAKLVDDVYNK